jgi:beta-1,2-mannobiose phosphorylase / 1,2-beta-oligomannan phosphorylase
MNPSFSIERLNDAQPILTPTDLPWENDGAINAAAVYLARSTENEPILHGLLDADILSTLPDGAVTVIYRAIARQSAHQPIPVSSAGLALFTPDMRLLRRLPSPVLLPGAQPDDFDSLGIEDPRVTQIGGTFYMLYCGPTQGELNTIRTRLCLATSKDLLHWEKHGPIPGSPDLYNNKDGVLFPEPINGKYYLLHRPWGKPWDREIGQQNYQIWLASAETPLGPWQEHGPILTALPNLAFYSSWLGGGSVPIPLGHKRFLVIYHTGNFTTQVDRRYDAAAAIFDFNKSLTAVVTARLEPFMLPEAPAELNHTPEGHAIDVVFPCGSYLYKDDVYIIYGAGDKNTCAARMNFAALVAAVEKAGLESSEINP